MTGSAACIRSTSIRAALPPLGNAETATFGRRKITTMNCIGGLSIAQSVANLQLNISSRLSCLPDAFERPPPCTGAGRTIHRHLFGSNRRSILKAAIDWKYAMGMRQLCECRESAEEAPASTSAAIRLGPKSSTIPRRRTDRIDFLRALTQIKDLGVSGYSR
jgi:hypothetical protein